MTEQKETEHYTNALYDIDNAEDAELNEWEIEFVSDLIKRRPSVFTQKQKEKIDEICGKHDI